MRYFISFVLTLAIITVCCACNDGSSVGSTSDSNPSSESPSSVSSESFSDNSQADSLSTSSTNDKNPLESVNNSSSNSSSSSSGTQQPANNNNNTEVVCSHSCTKTVYSPTLYSEGYDEHICSKCGYTYRDNFKKALEPEKFSEGLEFESNYDGSCTLIGIGSCTDTSINIPPKSPSGELVTTIKASTFRENKNIVEVRIPDTVTTLSGNIFYDCNALKTVTMSKNVTALPDFCFYSCGKLEKIEFSGSKLTTIGENAFSTCVSLVSIALPPSLSEIKNYAFDDCTKLVSVTYGDTPLTVGIKAFDYCTSLKECRSINSTYSLDTINSFGNSSFRYTKLSKIAFSSKLKRLGEQTFESCFSLGSVDLRNTQITYIPANCFYNTSLSSIYLPDSIETICGGSFSNNRNLKTFTVPDSVTRIDGYAFKKTAFNTLYIGSGIAQIGERCFEGCTGQVIWSEYCAISSLNKAYYGYQGTSITLPDSLTEIYRGALEGCTKLEYLSTPMYYANLGDYTSHCLGSLFKDDVDPWNQKNVIPTTLKTVVLTRSSNIEPRAFMELNLTNLVLSEFVDSISEDVFYLGSVTNVLYKGLHADWNLVDNHSQKIAAANIYYYSESRPSSGKYWHYDENGVPVKW